MSNQKIAEQFLAAIERNDFQKAESLLAADFKFTGISSEPFDAKESLNIYKAFSKRVPDFKFNPKFLNEHGEVVEFSIALTGNKLNDFPSGFNINAESNHIALPEEKLIIVIDNDKIESIAVKEGGIRGLLKQMGFITPLDELYP